MDFTWIAFITTKITDDLEEVKLRLQRPKGESNTRKDRENSRLAALWEGAGGRQLMVGEEEEDA